MQKKTDDLSSASFYHMAPISEVVALVFSKALASTYPMADGIYLILSLIAQHKVWFTSCFVGINPFIKVKQEGSLDKELETMFIIQEMVKF